MSVKNIIKLTFTCIFIVLSVIFIGFFRFPDMIKDQEKTIDDCLDKILIELKHGELTNKTIESIPKDLLFAVWFKKKDATWVPIAFDETVLNKNNLIKTDSIPKYLSLAYRPYYYPKTMQDYQFLTLINNYNVESIMIYLILPLLFLLLTYLIIFLVIELLMREEKEEYLDDLELPSSIYSFDKDNGSSNKQVQLLDYYRNLWLKNFKISEDFKNKFPFKNIYELVRFGIKPEKYISEVLDVASQYFKWNNPKLYIFQKDIFIESSSKEMLDVTSVKIPHDGTQKGQIFIPLFPYKVSTIYGYFYFEWNAESDFFISDILYFLKFFFSDRAKSIFLNYKELENIVNILKIKLEKQTEVAIAIIEVDNKDKVETEFKQVWKDKLNHEIKENLIRAFKDDIIFQISSFTFGIIIEVIDKNKSIAKMEEWIKDSKNQSYSVSKEYGDIVITYSCGISFKKDREIHPLVLINEAENNLKDAIGNGRNQVVGQ